MSRKTFKRTSYVVLTIVLAVIGLLFLRKSANNKGVRTLHTSSIESSSDIEGMDFVLVGEAKITHAIHAHAPLVGGMGKDSYRFKGRLEYERKTSELDVSYEPIELCKTGKEWYLLGQYHFVNTRFQWYTITEGREAKPIHASATPTLLVHIDFADRALNRRYKLWCLGNLCEQPVEAVALFNDYVAHDPRALLIGLEENRRHKGTGFEDFLRLAFEDPKSYAGIWDSLATMLDSTEPDDHEQEIRFIGLALLKLDKQRGAELLVSRRDRWKSEDIENDVRLDGIEPVLEHYEKGTWP
jgi:hypothetical protein